MANHDNIYSEMLASLPVPERLNPVNIAAFLEANKPASKTAVKMSGSVLSRMDADTQTRIEASSPAVDIDVGEERGKRSKAGSNKTLASCPASTAKTVYRTIASLAACAAMVFGFIRYFDVGEIQTTDAETKGSSYASDYNELHKTFRKYYADDEDKVTLDSAIAEIEHSYTDGDSDVGSDSSLSSPTIHTEAENSTDVTSADENGNDNTPDVPESSQTDDPVTISEEELTVTIADGIVLPTAPEGELTEDYVISQNRIYVKDGSTVKVVVISDNGLEYVGDAVPENGLFETRTLEDIYAIDSRLAAVYAVTTEEPLAVPADSTADEETLVSGLISSVYSETESKITGYSAEVVIYDISDSGEITTASVISFSGSYIDSVIKDGYIYVVTSYDGYKTSPLVGDNLDTYVPSYTVNGEKLYIEATDILIPESMSTLDYTVVGGIAAALPATPVCVQAVLGYEGKVVVSDGAVYVFGYTKVEETSIEMLSLSGGMASFAGSATVEGVALTGGISLTDNALLLAALRNSGSDSVYITAVYAFDKSLNLLSEVDFPEAYQTAEFEGSTVVLSSGTGSAYADFSNPSLPTLPDGTDADPTESLVGFGGGYIILTKDDSGRIALSFLEESDNGELGISAKTIVCDYDCECPAVDDNRLLYCDSANDLVGVSYRYYDGYDYCCTYALYKLNSSSELSLVGSVSSHEVDSAFEFGRTELHNGILYAISEGRIYALGVSQGSVSIIGTADLIESSYSGHITW